MSLKAGCEIVVVLESFRNVDLQNQGLYSLTLHIEKGGKERHEPLVLGQPYTMLQIGKELRCRKKNKIRGEAEIYDAEYLSKTFLVKYNDEEIDLQEVVIFRIELDNFPEIDDDNVELVVDLNYSAEQSISPTEKVNTVKQEDKLCGSVGLQLKKVSFPIKQVSTCRLRLNNIEKGICDYSRFCFDGKNLGQLALCVFTIVMDVKFRSYMSLRKIKTQEDLHREKIDTLSDFYEFAHKKLPNCVDHFYTRYIKHLRYHSYITKGRWLEVIGKDLPNPITLPRYVTTRHTDLEEVEASPKEFFEYFSDYKPKTLQIKNFQSEIYNICLANHTFMQQFLDSLQKGALRIDLLREQYMATMKDRCGQYIFRNCIKHEHEVCHARQLGKEKRGFAKKIRKKSYYHTLSSLNIEDARLFPQFEQQPIMFHDVTTIKPPVPRAKAKHVLFVFVHGFQGSTADLRTIRNKLKQFYPYSYFLLSRSNEADTFGDIGKMGQRLANEICEYVRDFEIEEDLVIHMVGHSLGGIIARAALPYLEAFTLGSYASFSSPHLGYLNGTRPVIETGMWFLRKFKKTYSLEQLSMADQKTPEETFMYKLASFGSFSRFRKVILISSYEDNYVPWHSARVQSYKGEAQQKKSMVENAMISSMFAAGDTQKIHRIDISYEIAERQASQQLRNLDSMLGRTAHIEFLENETVLNMMLFCLPELFER